MPAEEGSTPSHRNRPAPLEIIAGEDNYDRWRTFKESWADYALLEDIYSERPAIQVASFRVALGEANRELLRNLNVGGIPLGGSQGCGGHPALQKLDVRHNCLGPQIRAS